jgi:hypothetical protein
MCAQIRIGFLVLISLLVAACAPNAPSLNKRSVERECFEAALAMAQVSDATLANATSNIDGKASEAWAKVLASVHKWRMRTCGR